MRWTLSLGDFRKVGSIHWNLSQKPIKGQGKKMTRTCSSCLFRLILTFIEILGGGWFEIFFTFSLFVEDSHFDWYFSNGLKPPTRIYSVFSLKPCWYSIVGWCSCWFGLVTMSFWYQGGVSIPQGVCRKKPCDREMLRRKNLVIILMDYGGFNGRVIGTVFCLNISALQIPHKYFCTFKLSSHFATPEKKIHRNPIWHCQHPPKKCSLLQRREWIKPINQPIKR